MNRNKTANFNISISILGEDCSWKYTQADVGLYLTCRCHASIELVVSVQHWEYYLFLLGYTEEEYNAATNTDALNFYKANAGRDDLPIFTCDCEDG